MTHASSYDVIILLAAFGLVAVLWAIFDPINLFAWLREEWRLMRAETWADGEYEGEPGTVTDPDVRAMVARQRAFGERLRWQGKSLLSGKEYRPVLTKPADPPPPPPMANRVFPIRRAKGNR